MITLPATPEPDGPIDWDGARAAFGPLLARMGETPQDPRWHAEGDVLTHTRAVCEELVAGAEYRSLPAARHQGAFLAALLHDCGKPAATRITPDGIESPNHASIGALLARSTLYRGGVDPDLREEVCRLIALHHRPIKAVKAFSYQALAQLSVMTDGVAGLHALVAADARGRVCAKPADRDYAIEMAGMFGLMAEEIDCAARPWPYHSPHAMFLGGHGKSDRWIADEPYDDFQGTVTILSGLPGAGKDSWADAHANGRPVISLDAIRQEIGRDDGAVIQEAMARAKQFMAEGRDFVWNATNTTRLARKKLVDLATQYRVHSEIVALDVPYPELLKRNQARPMADQLPPAAIEKMIDGWAFPVATEAHRVLFEEQGASPGARVTQRRHPR